MKTFDKTYKFEIDNTNNFESKLKGYFDTYHFRILKKDDQNFTVSKKGGLLTGWKLNPLEWESKIEFTVKNKKIKIKYVTDGIYITPIAFSSLYNNFINNFVDYLVSNKSYKTDNEHIIKAAKKRMIMYSVVLFLIGIIIIILSNYVTTIIKNRIVGLLFIGASFYASEKVINGFLVKKYQNY